MLTPTIGRIVMVETDIADVSYPAIITNVRSEEPPIIDVVAFNGNCETIPVRSFKAIPMVDEYGEVPEGIPYAVWMPFQIGQDALTAKIAAKFEETAPAAESTEGVDAPVLASV